MDIKRKKKKNRISEAGVSNGLYKVHLLSYISVEVL